LILHPQSKSVPFENLNTLNQVTLLVGPEGGFSEEEVAFAIKAGFESWSLGPRILRTETAPLSAISILQNRFGDL